MSGACKRLNLNLIYDRQSKIREEQEESIRMNEAYEENEKQKEEIQRKNEIHVKIIEELFDFLTEERKSFKFSEWFNQLDSEKQNQYAENKRVFLVLLKLFEIAMISISEFLEEESVNETCNGEFDLSYCLYQILKQKKRNFNFDGIKIEKLEETFQVCMENEGIKEKIEMNDMKIIRIGEKDVARNVTESVKNL